MKMPYYKGGDGTKGDFVFTDISHIQQKTRGKRGKLNKNWLLLDNQSTVSIMCNKQLVKNI